MHKLQALLATLVVACGLTLVAAPAHAFGSKDNCDQTNDWFHHTNTWQAFTYHKISIQEDACIRGVFGGGIPPTSYYSWLKFVDTPDISFPNTVPGGGLEDVSLASGPVLDNVWRYGDDRNNRAYKVRYTFTVKQCVFKIGCDIYPYSFTVDTVGTKICAEYGSDGCDVKKNW